MTAGAELGKVCVSVRGRRACPLILRPLQLAPTQGGEQKHRGANDDFPVNEQLPATSCRSLGASPPHRHGDSTTGPNRGYYMKPVCDTFGHSLVSCKMSLKRESVSHAR
jgi:hypothetical protein